MPDYPPGVRDAAVRAAEAESEIGYSTPPEIMATAILDAIAPLLGEHVAKRILDHMNAHGPRPGSRLGGKPADDAARWAWRRHFGIAARIAARAFLTEEDEKRLTAEALARGDFVACDLPEEQQ
jgi:hypothetical protein